MPLDPAILDALTQQYAQITSDEFRGATRMIVPRDSMLDVLTALKRDHGFDLLVDITCVDYLNFRGATDRFGLVYQLARTGDNQRVTIRVMLNEPELSVPSLVPLWEGANWMEREVYDMFGIEFDEHPELRRILLPDAFTAHPLRKDYPLQGRGERHNFPTIARRDA